MAAIETRYDAAVRDYREWLEGNITEEVALRSIQAHLDEIEAAIERKESYKAIWRRHIEEIVYQLGGKAKIDGLAEYRITEPYQTVTYDRKEIDKVLHEALEAGDIGTAHALEAARKVSERAGTLMIRREKRET